MFDPKRIVPDDSLSLAEGAVVAWDLEESQGYYQRLLDTLAEDRSLPLDKPWKKLSKKMQRLVLEGDAEYELEMEIPVAGRRGRGRRKRKTRSESIVRAFDGVLGDLERRLDVASGSSATSLKKFQSPRVCEECSGERLRAEARSIRFGPHSLPRSHGALDQGRQPLPQRDLAPRTRSQNRRSHP